MPTRGVRAWQAVTITIVSPERTMTLPSACLASFPVSIDSVRLPSVTSRVGMVSGQGVRSCIPTRGTGPLSYFRIPSLRISSA